MPRKKLTGLAAKLHKLTGHHSPKSGWLGDAKFRIKNKIWLNYSSQIARRIMAAVEDIEGLTKESLAKQVGINKEKLQRILSGHENLSLKLISKFSKALKVDLISFPDYKYNLPIKDMPKRKNEEFFKD